MRNKQTIPKQSQLNEINSIGENSIKYYKDILSFIEIEFNKSQEKTVEDFSTIITIKLHLARLYSKLDSKDIKRKVNNLAISLKLYEETYIRLKTCQFINSNGALLEQMQICEEMIQLLPTKISKINRGEEI
jgi:hypothetical protein